MVLRKIHQEKLFAVNCWERACSVLFVPTLIFISREIFVTGALYSKYIINYRQYDAIIYPQIIGRYVYFYLIQEIWLTLQICAKFLCSSFKPENQINYTDVSCKYVNGYALFVDDISLHINWVSKPLYEIDNFDLLQLHYIFSLCITNFETLR